MQGEKELLAKYTNSRLASYMEDNNRVTYCPSTPWCGHAIEVGCHLDRAWHKLHSKVHALVGGSSMLALAE